MPDKSARGVDDNEDDDDDDDLDVDLLRPFKYKNLNRRNLASFRKLWDCDYLVNLTLNEKLFIAEYRVDPGGFDVLHELLGAMLLNSSAAHISSASRLGAALIMLAGGSSTEAMRTHKMSMSTVDDNFHRVIDAINNDPALKIVCDNSSEELQKRSSYFKHHSVFEIFKYCAGVIDGLAIRMRAPTDEEIQNHSRSSTGSKYLTCKLCVTLNADLSL